MTGTVAAGRHDPGPEPGRERVQGPGPATSRPARGGAEARAVAVGGAVLLVWAAWRVQLGASLGDDGHLVALPLRLSRGARPLVDEMNVQALGSVWAAPFLWLWTHVVGTTGLVIASRVLHVLAVLGVVVVCHRALGQAFGPVAAVTAPLVALLAPPYDLLALSYNTAPVLGFVLATCAALAALDRGSRRWAAVSGAALAAGVFSNPVFVAPGLALVLSVAALTARARLRPVGAAFAGGLLGVAVPVTAWLGLVVGPGAVAATLTYTSEYLGERRGPLQKMADVLETYRMYVPVALAVTLVALSLLAALPLPRRLRAPVVAAIPAVMAVAAFRSFSRPGSAPAFGVLPTLYLAGVGLALVVPVTAWAWQRRDGRILTLLALGLPATIVGVPVLVAATSSSSWWGIPVTAGAPLVVALVLGWDAILREAWPFLRTAADALLLVVVVTLMSASPFRDPPPDRLTERIGSGAYAGVLTTPANARAISTTAAALARLVRPGDGVLFYASPGGYLLVDAEPVTNILWLADFGAANRATLEYFGRVGRTPDVVVVSRQALLGAGGLAGLARRDPLAAFVQAHYRIVDPAAGTMVVLRRT